MKKRNKQQEKRRTKDRARDIFHIINVNAAGIDVRSAQHWVAVPEGRDEQPVRRSGCFTPDLYALSDWLKECDIETVAMESTGFQNRLSSSWMALLLFIVECWPHKLHRSMGVPRPKPTTL